VLLAALTLELTAGCHAFIHQYPDLESHPPDSDPSLARRTLVIVEVNVDRLPPKLYKAVAFDASWSPVEQVLDPIRSDAYRLSDTLSLRVQLELYDERNLDDPVAYRVYNVAGDDMTPTDTLHFDLPEGSYTALAWADYAVAEAPEDDRFFLTDRLTNVETLVDGYPDNTYERSCMAGMLAFDVDFGQSENDDDVQVTPRDRNASPPTLTRATPAIADELLTRTVSVTLKRPVGCYCFIPTDDDAFIAQGGKPEEVSVRIVYKQFVATGYNVLSSLKNLFVSSYEVQLPSIFDADTPDEEQPLFGDYLFCNPGAETIVVADLYLYDGRGRLFNRCQNLRIPLMQNRKTLIYGPCLTQSSATSGGVALDENFEGETVIRFN
jgi:hypothetical protein